MKVVVQRSAVKMWLLAIGAIPFLVISIDVLVNRRIANWLRELLFSPEDTQIYESRDVIWAWVMLIFAGVVILWGLKELFFPTKVIEYRENGLAIKVRGPLRPHDVIPWSNIVDLTAGEVEDEGDTLSLLGIQLIDRLGLPDHPWGARWVENRVLGVLAQDWSESPGEVARKVSEYMASADRGGATARPDSIWNPSP